jgi:hypothetical protein
MKHLFFFILLFTGFQTVGQITCNVFPTDTIVCYRDTCTGEGCTIFRTEVSGTGPYIYQWYKNGALIAGATDSILVFSRIDIQDTALYYCIASKGADSDTSNLGHLRMHPKMSIDTFEIDPTSIGCPDNCKGKIKLVVTGGSGEFNYNVDNQGPCSAVLFEPFSQTLNRVNNGDHLLTISDTNNCRIYKNFNVDVLRLPKVEFTKLPKDTVYLSNPLLTVSFPDSAIKYLTNWEWDFGDSTLVPNLNPAEHIYKYVRKYIVELNYTDLNGCDTTVSQELTVKTARLKVPNVFTPDNDPNMVNESFIITIEDSPEINFGDAYMSNELVILDRWGRKVFSKLNYRSNKYGGDWKGENLSDGVYYYMLMCHGYYGDEVFKGSVTILRTH